MCSALREVTVRRSLPLPFPLASPSPFQRPGQVVETHREADCGLCLHSLVGEEPQKP